MRSLRFSTSPSFRWSGVSLALWAPRRVSPFLLSRGTICLLRFSGNRFLRGRGAALVAGTWVAVAVISPHGSYIRSPSRDVLSAATVITPPPGQQNCVVNGIRPVESVAELSGESCAPCAGEGLYADVARRWRPMANFFPQFPPGCVARRLE